MHIRYLMLDNGIEFQEQVVTVQTWGDLKPKTVCIRHRNAKQTPFTVIVCFDRRRDCSSIPVSLHAI